MKEVIFDVKSTIKETGEVHEYQSKKIIINEEVAQKLCDNCNRLGQIGPIEYIYEIESITEVGLIDDGSCIYGV